MNTLSLNTKLSEIKIGDYFKCATKEEKNYGTNKYYGHYNWAKVSKIDITKSGRITIFLEGEFQYYEQIKISTIRWSNGPLVTTRIIEHKI
jgi:hypothetical protein